MAVMTYSIVVLSSLSPAEFLQRHDSVAHETLQLFSITAAASHAVDGLDWLLGVSCMSLLTLLPFLKGRG